MSYLFKSTHYSLNKQKKLDFSILGTTIIRQKNPNNAQVMYIHSQTPIST